MPLVVPCLPVYRRCCCCSVRTGSIILAWLSMILFMISFVLVCVVINQVNVSASDSEETMLSMDPSSQRMEAVKIQRKFFNYINFNMVLVLLLLVVDGVFSGMLLYGIHYRKPSFMVPRLTVSVVCITFSIFCTCYYFIAALYGFLAFEDMSYEVREGPPLYFIFLAMLIVSGVMIPVEALVLYLWNVVYSHYRELEISLNTDQYGKLMEMSA